MSLQTAFRFCAVETARRQGRQRRPGRLELRLETPFGQPVGIDDLARFDAGKVCREALRGNRRHDEFAGRNIGESQRQTLIRLDARQGGDEIVLGALEQRILGEGTRRDEADDITAHDGFRTTLPGFGRVLELLANGDAMAGADQPFQIMVGRMHRHAAHRDFLALVTAALGERYAQGLRRRFRIGKEQLVEIAHAIEQKAARMGGLDLEILGHHRRGGDSVALGVHVVHRALIRQVVTESMTLRSAVAASTVGSLKSACRQSCSTLAIGKRSRLYVIEPFVPFGSTIRTGKTIGKT